MSNGNIPEIPDFAEKAIENVLDEPTKAMGSTFADIWFLALGGPIGQLAQKRRIKYAYDLKLFKQKTEEEISKIPQEKRLEADIQIVGPILEAAKYCAEKEQLRNMFAKRNSFMAIIPISKARNYIGLMQKQKNISGPKCNLL